MERQEMGESGKRLQTALKQIYGQQFAKGDAVMAALADLRELCDSRGLDFDELDRVAFGQYIGAQVDAERRRGQRA